MEQEMTGMWNRLQQKMGGIFIVFILIFMVPSVHAFDLPGFKSFKLPSFRYGKLKRDREVNRSFQTYRVLEDHNYYTSGPGKIPHAILGVQNDFNLRPGIWKPVKLTTPMLRNWVTNMDNIYGYPPYGCRVLDDNG